ncbi:MAG: hypothetical protein JXR39_11605 [Marinilabiliaceae bacterium]|nr:hypothetical protein [Marinilabiliaceae bacterium]
MNTTAISNLLRVLESRESDGSASVKGADKIKVIAKFKEKLSEAATGEDVMQSHNYYIRALDLTDGSGKAITGQDRADLVSSHVALLTGTWANADYHLSSILDALQRRDDYATGEMTVTGDNRETLKTKLIELIENL